MQREQEKRSLSPLKAVRETVGSWKKRYDDYARRAFGEGIMRDMVGIVFAFVIAFLFLKALGFVLNTDSPLVVIESESMIHREGWWQWHIENGLGQYLSSYPFGGGMGIGDVDLVVGEDPNSIEVGDVIVYINPLVQNPIIHRVVGIADLGGSSVTRGIASYSDGYLVYPCDQIGEKRVDLKYLREFYEGATYNGKPLKTDSYRLYITKGDNNALPDQCSGVLPVHSGLVVGTAKFGVPIVGYVKLGFVCALNYASGNACSSRCWWTDDNQRCRG